MAPQETETPQDFTPTAETVQPAAPDVFAQISASKQADPQAHSFDNVAVPAEAASTVPGGPITLSETLGLAGKPLVRKGITFVQQSPALEDLDEIFEVQEQIQGSKKGKAMITLASFVLYVADASAPDTLRRATAQEIGKSFGISDIGVLSDVVARNLNMSEQANPNALAPAGA